MSTVPLDPTAFLASKQVWFLTGSQGLYGEDTLRQVAEQSRAIADQLSAAEGVPVELVWKPVLTDSESIKRTMLEANLDDAVKAAVMAEDVARTVHISRQLGEPIPIPQESIDALFDRYQNVYGQKPSGALS